MDEIRIGTDVYCGNEKVGRVARLIADARSAHITDIVVDPGLLHAAKVVPIGKIRDVAPDRVTLSIDRQQLEHADGFTDEKFDQPGGDWTAPPGYDRRDFLLNTEVAFGAGAGYGTMGTKPSPFPPSPSDPRPDLIRPDVKQGSPILSVDGERVGEVADLAFHPEDGSLVRLVLKRGFLGRDHVEVPLDLVEDIAAEGVILRVTKAEVEQMQSTARD